MIYTYIENRYGGERSGLSRIANALAWNRSYEEQVVTSSNPRAGGFFNSTINSPVSLLDLEKSCIAEQVSKGEKRKKKKLAFIKKYNFERKHLNMVVRDG